MTEKCGYCGMAHDTVCHMIKSIEYHKDGSVKRVEFKTFPDYGPQQNIPNVFTQPTQQVWPPNVFTTPTHTITYG